MGQATASKYMLSVPYRSCGCGAASCVAARVPEAGHGKSCARWWLPVVGSVFCGVFALCSNVVRSSRVDGKGGLLPHVHITSNVYSGYGYRLLDLLSSNTGEALRFLKLCINHYNQKARQWRGLTVISPLAACHCWRPVHHRNPVRRHWL